MADDLLNIKALARTTAAIIIVVIVVIAGVGVGLYYATVPSPPATSTAVTTAALRDTLTIDDLWWPPAGLNVINNIIFVLPMQSFVDVYQSILTLNGTLLYQTGETQVLPMLATDWSVSPDGTVYTFNLRQNVTFSNGDPFNAYQVWGDWYGIYYLSGNSSAFLNGYKVFDFSKASFGPATLALMTRSGVVNPTPDLLNIMMNNTWPIYVTGPYQIILHLKAPFIWLPQALATFVGMMFDTQYVLENGGFGLPGAANTYFNSHEIPATGPYKVVSVMPGSFVSFTQNPNYWGRNLSPAEIQANPYLDPGHVKNVIVNIKSDDVVRYADLRTGSAQISAILSEDWPLVLANPDEYSYFLEPNNSMLEVGLSMNPYRYPTNITAFRQAIVHAINYTDINQKVYGGTLVPYVGPEWPAFREWNNLNNFQPYSYNLTLARQYLEQSGVNVATLPQIELANFAGQTSQIDASQIIQEDLGQIGITVNVVVLPVSEAAPPYESGYATYAADMAVSQQIANMEWMGFGTMADVTGPTPADPWMWSANDNPPCCNFAMYSTPASQKCIDAWTSTMNTTVIKNLCAKAEAEMYYDAPYIWLGTPKLALGGGSLVWDNHVVRSLLMDDCFTASDYTAIFNTVTFVGS
ncbi:MAG: ABC transporter substrate-binding protein [Candidatus Bathyarchaeia archaeon]